MSQHLSLCLTFSVTFFFEAGVMSNFPLGGILPRVAEQKVPKALWWITLSFLFRPHCFSAYFQGSHFPHALLEERWHSAWVRMSARPIRMLLFFHLLWWGNCPNRLPLHYLPVSRTAPLTPKVMAFQKSPARTTQQVNCWEGLTCAMANKWMNDQVGLIVFSGLYF